MQAKFVEYSVTMESLSLDGSVRWETPMKIYGIIAVIHAKERSPTHGLVPGVVNVCLSECAACVVSEALVTPPPLQ